MMKHSHGIYIYIPFTRGIQVLLIKIIKERYTLIQKTKVYKELRSTREKVQ